MKMTGDRGRQLARRVIGGLRREYGNHGIACRRPAIEELILGVLAQGSSERRAVTALNALSRNFVDWNEVRISSSAEIALVIDMPSALEKANLLREVLHRVYEVTNEMSLDFLKDRTARDAVKLVAGVQGFPEDALARATILSLGLDAFPLTPSVARVCQRLDLVSDGAEPSLESILPKSGLFEFHWLICRHASAVCTHGEPACGQCCIRKECASGRGKAGAAGSSGRAQRASKVSVTRKKKAAK